MVEGVFHCVHQGDLVTIELSAHLVDFFSSYAVLACDAPTHFNTQLKDFSSERFSAFQFAFLVGIEEDQGVHISVARVEYVRYPQAVFIGKLLDSIENTRKLSTWNGSIHAVVVRRDPAHGREGVLPTSPKTSTFCFIASDPDFGCAG
ncbi:hypothetical protein D3C79_755030 [compost metagenome]